MGFGTKNNGGSSSGGSSGAGSTITGGIPSEGNVTTNRDLTNWNKTLVIGQYYRCDVKVQVQGPADEFFTIEGRDQYGVCQVSLTKKTSGTEMIPFSFAFKAVTTSLTFKVQNITGKGLTLKHSIYQSDTHVLLTKLDVTEV